MVATNAPSPRQPAPGRSEPDASELGFDDPATMTVQELMAFRKQASQERAAEARRRERERRRSESRVREQAGEHADHRRQRDPSPAEIAARCAEIRNGWSEDEHRRRAAGYIRPEGSDTRNGIGFVTPSTWTAPVCRMATMRKGVLR